MPPQDGAVIKYTSVHLREEKRSVPPTATNQVTVATRTQQQTGAGTIQNINTTNKSREINTQGEYRSICLRA